MIRDHALSVGDQCNNPGSMYKGSFAERFGCTRTYEIPNGHNCAIFDTPAHGAACLVELILNRKRLTLREYLCGGENLAPEKSYSGGANYENYLLGMTSHMECDESEVIREDDRFLVNMINAHSRSEGNRFRMTHDYWYCTRRLLQKYSKVYEG